MSDLAPILPLVISIVFGVAGAWYARRRGLPDIDAEVESRTKALVDTLRAQIEDCKPRLASAEQQVANLRDEIHRRDDDVARLYRRIGALENHK